MTVGSLFAGIGGFDLGLERAGMEIRWQVEIDPFCQAVLAKHWPHVKRYDDVRTVGAYNLERVDVLCGGFPCQDISNAGKGEGIDGKRSGLWAEYARLIRELRPRYAIVENVAALLGRGLGRVLGDLAACGYDAEWDCLPASAVGAAHQRDRLWLVAYPTGSRGGRLPVRQGRQNETALDAIWSGAHVADPDGAGLPFSWHAGATRESAGRIFAGATVDRSRWWAVEPAVGRVAHGVPRRVDRLRGLGNAVVPQIVEWIGRRLMELR
jgi:DNA (cytosine-5)-methyltransferase 1